jgi:hypothetical protein
MMSDLTWLSDILTPKLKIIVSSSDDTAVFQSLKTSLNDEAFLLVSKRSHPQHFVILNLYQ